MVVTGRLRLRHAGCITETLTGGSYAVEITSDESGDLVFMHGETPEAVDRFLTHVESSGVDVHKVVSRTPTDLLYRTRNPMGGVFTRLYKHECSVLWPVVYRDGLEFFTIVAPSREHFARLRGDLLEIADVVVESVSDVPAPLLDAAVPLSDLASDLTQRQLDLLLIAVELGYYESPRRISSTDLARRVGLSASTLCEHLRKADQRVVARFARLLSTHAGLSATAMRTRGRPRGPARDSR